MMKDLVLEWMGEGDFYYDEDLANMTGICFPMDTIYEQNVQEAVILPNVKGQRYVFGSVYPGDWEGEEFIFCRNNKILVNSTHCTITVDKHGQYWIQNDTDNFKTFLNSWTVVVPQLLESGDIISVEESEFQYGYARNRPIFRLKERIIQAWSGLEIEGADTNNDSEVCKAMNKLDLEDEAESPLDNTLILSEIMSYLPVHDLKNARLVSKKWREETSKALEKRGNISFLFEDYENPENSTRVFRYLHEMRELKMRNLHIRICSQYYQNRVVFSPVEPGQKLVDDLRKLLKSSHNFSTLFLEADIQLEAGFLPFSLIFQELGEKLVELKLGIYQLSLPDILPPFPVMRNLKKFTGESLGGAGLRLVSHIVPLFSNNLEHFTCSSHMADTYFQEFFKHRMPNPKGIALKDEANETSLSALLELETPLTFLEIHYSDQQLSSKQLLESLFLKNSNSLQHLVIRIGNGYYHDKDTEVSFPPFPKLEVLELEYDPRTRIGWGHETSLDYEDHFPSLRKLTVRPRQPWREDDQVFNVFFRRRELKCETVKELLVPVLPNPRSGNYYASLETSQPRMDQIRKMFPSAGSINFFK